MESTLSNCKESTEEKREDDQKQVTQNEPQVFGRSEYAQKNFWDDRFKSAKGFFDWYLEYKELKEYFEKVYPIKKESSILMVGCGNSKLSEEMYFDGYKNLVNIDISGVVIENMKKYYEEQNINIECLEMDATKMTFENESFEVVIDKGTLDALMCGKDNEIVKALILEMTRVLKVNGELFIISHGNPVSRRELFRQTVDLNQYEFLYAEQKLSDVSQLINIFRSKLKDKPLSQILKNKELLKESLKEFTSIKAPSLAKRILEAKKRIDAGSAQQESAQEKTPTQEKEEPKKEKDEEELQTTPENKENTESQKEKSKEEASSKNDLQEQKENPAAKTLDYHPRRQAHCYIYYVRRLF